MKTVKFLSIAIAAIAAAGTIAVSCGSGTPEEKAAAKAQAEAAKDSEVKELAPSQSLTDSTSYLLGVHFGMIIKGNGIAEKLEGLNINEIKQGMKEAVACTENPRSEKFAECFKINLMEMNEIISNYISGRSAYRSKKNLKEGEIFLEELCKESGYIKTESGLVYRVIEMGDDVKAVLDTVTVGETKKAVADTVFCYYTGKFINGNEFDSCTKPAEGEGGRPASFPINQVIKGWTEGMQIVGQGGKIMLYIPANLAYGESPTLPEPNSTLVFEVEIEKVGKVDREAVKAQIAEDQAKAEAEAAKTAKKK